MMQMTKVILSVLAVVLAFSDALLFAIEPVTGTSRAAESSEQRVLPFRLPRDLSTPVITMTFTDPRMAGPSTVADLSIFADGRVTVTEEASFHRVISAQLPLNEWRKIQRELFVENDLLGCHTDDLQDKILTLRRQRRRPYPGPEAAATIFKIRGENLSHEVRCHAVGLTATQLPDLPDIQQLFACQQCLQNVLHVVRAGGYEQVNRTLHAVNTRLQRQLPGYGPLSSHDLSLVDARPDGTRYLQFSRTPCERGNGRANSNDLQTNERFLMVSVYERPGRPLEISIIGEPTYQ